MRPTITSLQNQRVKDALRLRERRGRKLQDRIIIDGAREVRRALEADFALAELYVCEELVRCPDALRVIELGREREVELLRVSPNVMGKLAFGQRIEGVIAVASTPRNRWPEDGLTDPSIVVVLERVEKPGNLGGVLRTADAAGVGAVLIADTKVDVYGPNTIRASLGTVFSLPVVSAAGTEILAWLRRQEIAMFAARVDGAIDYAAADFAGRVALVLGSEAEGLSPLWRAADITSVALPMLGKADSLNVSVTAAVLVYEALRQQRK
jgi:TrmH family RNA methyltransferase